MILDHIVPQRSANRPLHRARAGWGVVIAVLLHAAVILAFVLEMKHSYRIMGERDGDPESITVDIADAGEVAALTLPGGQEPSNPLAPPAPEAQQAASGDSAPAKQAAKPRADEQPLEKEAMAMLPLKVPTPGKGNDAATDHNTGAKKQESAKAGPRGSQALDLSVPAAAMNPSMIMGPQSAGMSRPANITRSGENDDFGRGVIRALRQTMPLPRGALGRVTVRFLLNERGNLQELRVIESTTDAVLTQSVAFAVRQSSFPIPPARSTVPDRTFIVTYLYR